MDSPHARSGQSESSSHVFHQGTRRDAPERIARHGRRNHRLHEPLEHDFVLEDGGAEVAHHNQLVYRGIAGEGFSIVNAPQTGDPFVALTTYPVAPSSWTRICTNRPRRKRCPSRRARSGRWRSKTRPSSCSVRSGTTSSAMSSRSCASSMWASRSSSADQVFLPLRFYNRQPI